MDLKFDFIPKSKAMDDFEKMFMVLFTPLKNHIQYNNLEDKLTDDDLHLMAHAIAQAGMQWCEFLKRANEHKNNRH